MIQTPEEIAAKIVDYHHEYGFASTPMGNARYLLEGQSQHLATSDPKVLASALDRVLDGAYDPPLDGNPKSDFTEHFAIKTCREARPSLITRIGSRFDEQQTCAHRTVPSSSAMREKRWPACPPGA